MSGLQVRSMRSNKSSRFLNAIVGPVEWRGGRLISLSNYGPCLCGGWVLIKIPYLKIHKYLASTTRRNKYVFACLFLTIVLSEFPFGF